MSDDKLEALRLIAPGIPKTAMGEIGKAFAFDDDRSEARRILQSAGAASGGASAVSGPNKNRCANFTLWQTGGQSDGTMAKARFNEMGTTVKGESFFRFEGRGPSQLSRCGPRGPQTIPSPDDYRLV